MQLRAIESKQRDLVVHNSNILGTKLFDRTKRVRNPTVKASLCFHSLCTIEHLDVMMATLLLPYICSAPPDSPDHHQCPTPLAKSLLNAARFKLVFCDFHIPLFSQMADTLSTRNNMIYPEDCGISRGTGPGKHDSSCPICREDFERQTPNLTHQECNRTFCVACLECWFDQLQREKAEAATCPLCRAVVLPAPPCDYDVDHGDFEVTHTEVSPYDGTIRHYQGVINWGSDEPHHDNHGCVHWSLVYRDLLRTSPFPGLREQVERAIDTEYAVFYRLMHSPDAQVQLSFSPAHHWVPTPEVRLSPAGERTTVERFLYLSTKVLLLEMYTAFQLVGMLIDGARIPLTAAVFNELRKRVDLPSKVKSHLRQCLNEAESAPFESNTFWIYLDWTFEPGSISGKLISVDLRQGDCTGRKTDLVFCWGARAPYRHRVQLGFHSFEALARNV